MSSQARNFGLITKLDDLKVLVDKLGEKGEPFGFDLETGYHGPDRPGGSLDIAWSQQFIAGLSLSGDPSWARYIPLAHDFGPNLDPDEVWPLVKPLLEQGKPVIHNFKFEARNLLKLGIRVVLYIDTMLDSYVLSETPFNGLKSLVKHFTGYDQPDISTLFPDATQKQLECLRFNILELTPEVVAYACDDAVQVLILKDLLTEKAKAERPLMHSLEYEIAQVMRDLESKGVAVDWDGLKEARAQAEVFVSRFEIAVKKLLGELVGRDILTMNLGSTKQLSELLYGSTEDGGLGLRTTRLTKKGDKMSTDAIALERLSREHPAIKKLLELREVNNLAVRIGKWLDEDSYAADNRAHANYNQVRVGSGRFAAKSPPIQQCPKEWRWAAESIEDVWEKTGKVWNSITGAGINGHDYWGGNFRDFIIAAPNHYLLTFDYSQIELRILAGVSQETALLEAFENGVDVHALTAAMMLGKPLEDLNLKTERPVGKTMNFALVYQMGPKSLAERLAIPQERANELYAMYFAQFPKVSTWIEKARREGKARGYVLTPFGRKWTIWELTSTSRAIYSKGERMLVNGPIQGGAADYTKLAMVRAARKLKEVGWWGTKCTIVMNQHDSLTFEVSDDLHPKKVRDLLAACVMFPVKNFPKITTDWELGQRWGSSTPWQDEPVEYDGKHWRVLSADSTVYGGDGPAESIHPTNTQTGNDSADSLSLESAPAMPPAQIHDQPAGADSNPHHYIVKLDGMPTVEKFARFLDLVSSLPGQNTLTLSTPEGDQQLDIGTSLSDKDQGDISFALGGATVLTAEAEVDMAALAEGLAL